MKPAMLRTVRSSLLRSRVAYACIVIKRPDESVKRAVSGAADGERAFLCLDLIHARSGERPHLCKRPADPRKQVVSDEVDRP